MSKVSVCSFRLIVSAATLAATPAFVKLSPIASALCELHLWTTTIPVMTSSGFRLVGRGGQIIPDNGSAEAGLTAAAHEADWAPLPNTRLRVLLYDKILDGPPFDVVLQVYSTAAIEVGGLLVVREPQYGVHDLVLHLSNWMERYTKKES